MSLAEEIYARVRHHGANLKIEGDGIAIVHEWKLPKVAAEVIAKHRIELFRYLEAKNAEFEERAAVLEYDEGLPRKMAEQWATMMVYEVPRLPPEDRSYVLTACGRIMDEEITPLLEERRAA